MSSIILPKNGSAALVAAAICVATAPSPSWAGESLIQNGSFEDEGTVMPVISSRANGTYAYGGDGCVVPGWSLTYRAGLAVQNSAFSGNVNFDIGTYAVFLRNGNHAWAVQDFEVAQPGCHRLSFDYWAWQSQSSAQVRVNVIHGTTTNNVAILAPSTTSGVAQRFSAPVNLSEAGSYRLEFYHPSNGGDGGTSIDNVSLVRAGDVNLVRNGDFEAGAISGDNYTKIGDSGYSNPYWTGGGVADANNWMGLCTYNQSGFFQATFWSPGKYALFMRNYTSTDTSFAQQEIAFDEPGLYRVSFTYLGWVTASEHLAMEVRLAHGATTNVIGAIDHDDARWGKAFAFNCYAEIPEAGTYALQFSMPGNTAVQTANLIDNVVVNRCGSPNLIRNGDFEAGGGSGNNYITGNSSNYSNPHWNGIRGTSVGLAKPGVGFNAGSQKPHAMGKYAFYFRGTLTKLDLWQQFAVSDAGIHHLSFLHWRWNKGGLPMTAHVLQIKDGGATTNVCGYAEFKPLALGGDTEYGEVSQFNGLVNLPEAGDYVLKFAYDGSVNDNGYATQIDSVSLVKYDADGFAAGDDAPLAVDMLPVSSDGSVVVPRAVHAARAVVGSGQVVKMGSYAYAGYNPAFRRNDGLIVMDELKVDTQYNAANHFNGIYAESSTGTIRAGKVVHSISTTTKENPRFRLHAQEGTARYVIGSGGFSFLDNRRLGANCQPYYAIEKEVRIDPSADYTVALNPYTDNNQAMFVFDGGTLTLGTTDFDDPAVARTVTFEGGIGSYAGGVMNVEGIGTVVFNATDNNAFAGTLNVKDAATLLYGDASTPGAGTINVEPGATLKVARSTNLAIGSALACEAGAVLSFDVSRLGEDVAAVTLNGFTPPESGCVTVKVTGRTGGGANTLLANLPEGVTKANFALDKTGLPGNASLAVQDGCLVLRPRGFMLIIK